jgi:hypothetical protein
MLEDEQYARLRAESQRSGLGLAELIRRAINQTYGTTRPDQILATLIATSGSWAEDSEDGETYVERRRPGLGRRLTEADR